MKLTKIKILSCFAIITSLFLLAGCTGSEKPQKDEADSKSISNSEKTTAAPTKPPKSKIDYKVIKTLDNKRFDGGINLYVLIDTVALKKAEFKKDIKAVVNELVKEYGSKTSIDFYDDKKVLELDYSLYGDLSLNRSTTPKENQRLELHHIAAFSGDLSTGLYRNTLYYYPNSSGDNKKVGKFVETIEYNPE